MTATAKELRLRSKEANVFSAIIESKLEDIVDQFYLSAGPKSRVSSIEAQERLAVLEDLDYALHRTKKLRAAVVDQPTDLSLNIAELELLHEVTAKLRLRYCQEMPATDHKIQLHAENILQLCSSEASTSGAGDSHGVLDEFEAMFFNLLEAVRASPASANSTDAPYSPDPAATWQVADRRSPDQGLGRDAASSKPLEEIAPIPWTVDMATSPLQVLDAIQEHGASLRILRQEHGASCNIVNYLGETDCHSLSSVARSILYPPAWDSEANMSTSEVHSPRFA
jgi:hypothetical protein